jgi:Mala s 1-like protein
MQIPSWSRANDFDHSDSRQLRPGARAWGTRLRSAFKDAGRAVEPAHGCNDRNHASGERLGAASVSLLWRVAARQIRPDHIRVRGGKVVWTYPIPGKEELGDCTMLSNGTISFSRRLGASEITPDKRTVWNYVAPPNTEIHTTYPIGRGRVLIMQNGNRAKVLIIRKRNGKIEKELVLETARQDNIHAQFRHVRITKAGTFLVAHLDLGKVVEYDRRGKPIWSVPRHQPEPQSV